MTTPKTTTPRPEKQPADHLKVVSEGGLTFRAYWLQESPQAYLVKTHGEVVQCTPVGAPSAPPDHPSWGQRGSISVLSPKVWQRTMRKWNRIPRVDGFATLTFGANWKYVASDPTKTKKKLNNLLGAMRKQFEDVVGGVWMLEFQKRGAPHFHVFTIHDRTAESDSDWKAKARWLKETWVSRGGGQQVKWKPAKHKNAAARYVSKGGSDRYQKEAPPEWSTPGRFFGQFGTVELMPIGDHGIVDDPDELERLGVRFKEDGDPYATSFPHPPTTMTKIEKEPITVTDEGWNEQTERHIFHVDFSEAPTRLKFIEAMADTLGLTPSETLNRIVMMRVAEDNARTKLGLEAA